MASSRVAEVLAAVFARSPDSAGWPGALVTLCGEQLPVTGVGMALMDDDGPAGTVAATDGAALVLEELQFTLGEGPCVDASRSGRPVLQADLERGATRRWPAFADGALAAGVRSVFAFPLRLGAIRVGVLDLYRGTPGPLSRAETADALCFADAATLVLVHLQTTDRPDGRTLEGHDGGPAALPLLDDRAEVHQATGVVSVRAGVPLDQALTLLRARAWADQRPIGDVARDVLAGALDLDVHDPGSPDPPTPEAGRR
jgi:hypothetical protein